MHDFLTRNVLILQNVSIPLKCILLGTTSSLEEAVNQIG